MDSKQAVQLAKSAFMADARFAGAYNDHNKDLIMTISGGPGYSKQYWHRHLAHKPSTSLPTSRICADADYPRATRYIGYCLVDKATGKCECFLGPEKIGGPVVEAND